MYRILVVDDDPVISALLMALLSRAGWQTTAVSDAHTALQHLERHACDVLVSDVNMPGMSGVELRNRVRANDQLGTLPIVLLTATTGDVAIGDATDAATLVLHKPVRPATFVADLQKWLQSLE